MVNECNRGQNSYNRIYPKLLYYYSISWKYVNLGFVFQNNILARVCFTVYVIAKILEGFDHRSGFVLRGFHAFFFCVIVFYRILFEQGAGLPHNTYSHEHFPHNVITSFSPCPGGPSRSPYRPCASTRQIHAVARWQHAVSPSCVRLSCTVLSLGLCPPTSPACSI